ncbi:PREDICTED: uncharacterized protein LOC18600153 isoform X2 [Theobroma cacao]|uniref:Uncharacterized protein LOC18600153 isoform X2 n=1 Tax=Theobroma cacao TaxID=3641 RepID=A0AB32V634_THECC|nr:PREDICTED: uncharacterized protein LOC18600153 isoform X2 [Theobroma cacao]
MRSVSRGALRPGDHIFSGRMLHLYFHHGIYVGKGTVTKSNNEKEEIDDAVIHFLGIGKSRSESPCERCGHSSRRIGVVITCLDCFLEDHSIYVYKYNVPYLKLRLKRSGTCTVRSSKPADEVIQTAFSLLEKNSFGNYNFFWNNCEDFATYCKTGVATSNQTAGVFFGFGVPGIIGYNVFKGILDRN